MHHFVDVKNIETLEMFMQWAQENGFQIKHDDTSANGNYRSVLLGNRKEPGMGHLLISWKR